MNATQSEQPVRRTALERLGATVADLDSEFYADPHRREVWNEASAVGFQAMLIGGLGLAAGMLWARGAAAVSFAQALVLLTGLVSMVVMGYARAKGVNATYRCRLISWRMLVVVLLAAALIGGFVHAGL